MKIFNVEPIKITEYIFNDEHLAKTHINSSYESTFDITGEIVESLNRLIIEFHILYTVDDETSRTIVFSNDPNKYTIHTTSETGSGEIFLSYKSSCKFNFESEGVNADVLSITEFLTEYCNHTKKFMIQYGFEPIQKKEEEIRMNHRIHEAALIAIENLRANNMYEF